MSTENTTSHRLVVISSVVAIVLVALAFWVRIDLQNRAQQADISNRDAGEEFAVGTLPGLGDPDAPVVLVEFGDYQCEFCARLLVETGRELRNTYVRDGVLRMYWRDFPVLGDASFDAAIAARCANEQDMFWQYHDLLLLRELEGYPGGFSTENLVRFARELDLAEGPFRTCLSERRHREVIGDDITAAAFLEVEGTPTLFINGERVTGLATFEEISRIIEQHQ